MRGISLLQGNMKAFLLLLYIEQRVLKDQGENEYLFNYKS